LKTDYQSVKDTQLQHRRLLLKTKEELPMNIEDISFRNDVIMAEGMMANAGARFSKGGADPAFL